MEQLIKDIQKNIDKLIEINKQNKEDIQKLLLKKKEEDIYEKYKSLRKKKINSDIKYKKIRQDKKNIDTELIFLEKIIKQKEQKDINKMTFEYLKEYINN